MSWLRALRRIVVILLLAALGWALLLFLVQDRLIFHPRPYPAGVGPPAGFVPLPFTTDDGAQTAWWVGPAAPRRWWVVFNGNGSLAWDWSGLPDVAADGATGFLVVDWPGYGASAGSPGRASIQRAADGAIAAALARHGALPPPGVLGHSLGAAAACEFAARRPVSGIVLAAPFTSLKAMARRQVGWPWCEVLRHRWDNVERLAEIAASASRPWLAIAHGDADGVIPQAMGRALAAAHPGWAEFIPMPGAPHDAVWGADPDGFAALMRR
ncbi:MAG: hypothetical protein RLZZ127_1530 [Planctomycetota bacterium]|jgi:pimeloyl-ACP methyl ester carboxylesterase